LINACIYKDLTDDLKSLLSKEAYIYRASETRTADVSLSLKARCNIENMGSYDYSISFHRNAFKPEQAAGVDTLLPLLLRQVKGGVA
jgi:N-acetylmuramoyl-L-alanine amidase